MEELDSQDIAQETPAEHVFIAPSIYEEDILQGSSYTHHSPVPEIITTDSSIECVLGVDEAGRGPVLGSFQCSFGSVYAHRHRTYGLRPSLPSTVLSSFSASRDPSFRRFQSPNAHYQIVADAKLVYPRHRPLPKLRLGDKSHVGKRHLRWNAEASGYI